MTKNPREDDGYDKTVDLSPSKHLQEEKPDAPTADDPEKPEVSDAGAVDAETITTDDEGLGEILQGDTVATDAGDSKGGSPAITEEEPGAPPDLGHYRLISELGRGGMGVVYLVEDPRLRRRIALKMLPKMADDPERLASFDREAQLLAALNHPNIATIYSLEDHAGGHFFTLEYIEGQTLAERFAAGPMGLEEIVVIGRQVASALQAAHKRGVVHRDLKPANIMETKDLNVKILDFGIAFAVGEVAQRIEMEEELSIAGTPGYMSPEQLRGQAIDARADIFAFGCILFEWLSGKRLFKCGRLSETIQRTLNDEPDWQALPVETPQRVLDLVKQCLEKDPEDRLATIADARRLLDAMFARRLTKQLPAEVDELTPNNLPRQLTSFVGRQRQLHDVEDLLSESQCLTLTGTGGCGKTRLAVEAARSFLPEFPDGIWIVELAPITDLDLVARTVATVLGLKEEPGRSVVEGVSQYLRDKNLLLILDNCEHVIPACIELVSEILAGCPRVRTLATSREGLGIPGEVIYQVPSMELPAAKPSHDLKALVEIESVGLFVGRAHAASPRFELTHETAVNVADICRRLDGIPLALELAAARVRVLSVADISKRLENRFRLLTGGSRTALARQQTLSATIDWSYDQLSEQEQRLLCRLSVFVGGWTLESAEEVCAGDGIEDWETLDLQSQLVDKSLVEVSAGTDHHEEIVRYRLLETIREYALDKLMDRSETGPIRAKHRQHFLELAENAADLLSGPEQAHWYSVLETEHENLRAALQDCIGDRDRGGDDAMRLISALGRFWLVHGHWSEGRGLIKETLECFTDGERTNLGAAVLRWAGKLAVCQADFEEAQRSIGEGLEILEEIGDRSEIAATYNDLGNMSQESGDPAGAKRHYEKSLGILREIGEDSSAGPALNNLGSLALHQGALDDAQPFFEESLSIHRRIGDQQGIAICLMNLGAVAHSGHDFSAARELYDEALAISRDIGNRRTERNALNNLGLAAQDEGDLDLARSFYDESLLIKKELGDRVGIAKSLSHLARLALQQEDYEGAMAYCQEGLELSLDTGDQQPVPEFLQTLAGIAAAREDTERGTRLMGAADALREAAILDGNPATLTKNEQEEIEHWVHHSKSKLGDDLFNSAWKEGRSLTQDQILEIALRGRRRDS